MLSAKLGPSGFFFFFFLVFFLLFAGGGFSLKSLETMSACGGPVLYFTPSRTWYVRDNFVGWAFFL